MPTCMLSSFVREPKSPSRPSIWSAFNRNPRTQLSLLCVLFTTFCEVGCTTNTVLPDAAKESSAIAYTQELRRVTSSGPDAMLARLPTPSTSYSDYETWENWWCPRHQEVHSATAVRQKLSQYCQDLGGTFAASFCRSDVDPYRVAFYATVSNVVTYVTYPDPSSCPTFNVASEPVNVRIMEPKPGMSMGAGYLAALRKVGYVTQEEDQAKAAAAQEQERRNQEQERKKQEGFARARILKNTAVGTKICLEGKGMFDRPTGYLVLGKPGYVHEDVTFDFVGFLESFSGSRIQIRISGIQFHGPDGKIASTDSSSYEGSEIRVNSIIWDEMPKWHTCE